MTILESIEQKVAIAVESINAILPEGYFTQTTISSTDFGNSGYIVIKKICPIDYIVQICKVRISDHYATNRFRENTEIMIDQLRFNLDELMTRIDRAMNPDNYENVEIRTLTDYSMESNFEIGKKPYTTLSEPTFLGEVITKKGNPAHRYSWLKEEVRYEWRKKVN
jgi:DNA-directed RNA polymerase beta subunit